MKNEYNCAKEAPMRHEPCGSVGAEIRGPFCDPIPPPPTLLQRLTTEREWQLKRVAKLTEAIDMVTKNPDLEKQYEFIRNL